MALSKMEVEFTIELSILSTQNPVPRYLSTIEMSNAIELLGNPFSVTVYDKMFYGIVG